MAAIRTVQRRRERDDSDHFETGKMVERTHTQFAVAQGRLNYLITQDDKAKQALEANVFDREEEKMDAWCFKRKEVREIYHQENVQIGIALIILANYMVEIARSQQLPDEGTAAYTTYDALEYFFTLFFLVELLINWYGSWFIRFFVAVNAEEHFGWNLFDLVIVIISLIALAFPGLPGITILRLFRAFRVARLFKRVESLNRISNGILKSIPGVLQVFVFLIIMMGIWAIMGVQMFSDDLPKQFQTWSWAMYTMFKCLMGDFIGINDELMYEHDKPAAVLFFASYVFLATILLMNVVVAVLLDAYLDYTETEEAKDSGMQRVEEHLREHKPTIYLKKAGAFQPIRSIGWDEIDKYKQLIYAITPTNSDDENDSDEFTKEFINDWSCDKVGKWLESAGYTHHSRKFAEHNIDGRALANLSIVELPVLGMPYGLQNKFAEALQGFLCRQARYEKRDKIIRAVFDEYDVDCSGFLSKEEFVNAWMQVLPEAEDLFNRESVGKMFDKLDADSQGQLDFEEFKKAQKMFESHAETDTKEEHEEKVRIAETISHTRNVSASATIARFAKDRMEGAIDSIELTGKRNTPKMEKRSAGRLRSPPDKGEGPETPNDTALAGTTPNTGSVELNTMNNDFADGLDGKEAVVE